MKCLEAEDGYYLASDVATKCVDGCGICTAAAYAGCTTAADGFWKDTTNSKLVACSAHCLTCTDASTCTVCDEANGWGLKDKVCVN
jgi:hypothetical protein